jgi:hypothetical protein|nr:hypothetical protein [Nitrosomonas nitrosa]
MSKDRADLGFSDTLSDFNPNDWQPKPARAANDGPARKGSDAKELESIGFRSREPKPAPVPAESGAGQGSAPRRRRTGRNAQFNLKARPETIEAFVAIADRQGWGLGETLEKAVELLEKAYGAQRGH